jgi:hypothetical protein
MAVPFARRFVVSLGVVAALVCASPLLLYWLGLHAAGGKPEVPAVLAPKTVQLAAWREARGVGQPHITPINPYTYLPLIAEPGPHGPSLLVAWRVASSHLLQHQRYKGMGWWHLSGASLTIWLTRNWSIDQLLTKASEA